MKKVLIFIVTLCMLVSISSICVWATKPLEEEEWVIEPTDKILPLHFSAATVNNKIYVMGGSLNSPPLKKVQIYDTKTKVWTQGEPMPETMRKSSAVSVGNDIYYIGGFGYPTGYYNTIQCYNTVTNTWEIKEPMNVSRYNHTAVAVGKKIYVIGGQGEKHFLNSVEIYDTQTGKWSTGSHMPTARHTLSAAYSDGKIYVIGGYVENKGKNVDTNVVEIYDIATDTWAVGEPLPRATRRCTTISVGNKIYVIGGEGKNKSVDIYDIKTGVWSKGKSLNSYRVSGQGVLVDGRIYAIEGNKKDSMESLRVANSVLRLAVLLNMGETVQLSVSDNVEDNSDLSWSSTNKAVATVDSNGKVTAIAEGDADIYAEDASGAFKEYIPVRVVKANADDMRLAAHLEVGEKVKLYLSDDTSDVSWKSMDQSIATVSSKGHVTAQDNGLAIIEGKKDGQVYQAYVRVSV